MSRTRRSRALAITSRTDFQRIFRHGRIVRGPHLVAHIAGRPSEEPGRVAVVVSKKHGGAVRRNRIRRRIRESVRRSGGPPAGVDAVVVARPGVEKLSFTEMGEEINQIMERAREGAAEKA